MVIGGVLLWIGFTLPSYRHFLPGLWPAWPATHWIGIALAVLGLAIAVWARQTLGHNWSIGVEVKEEHELVIAGPYALMRHPIYTGIILMLIGSVVSLGTPIALLGMLVMSASVVIKLRQEEQMMHEQFPRAYPDYERRVKRLIPFVW